MKGVVITKDVGEAELLSSLLEREQCNSSIVFSGGEALEKIRDKSVLLVICESHLADMTALEFITRAKSVNSGVLAMIIISHSDLSMVPSALNAGAVGFLVKPFTNYDLRKQVEQIRILSSSKRGRDFALSHLVQENQVMTFETGTLMRSDNFVLTTAYLTDRFTSGDVPVPPSKKMKYGLAIHEALRNSVEHGNMELSSVSKLDTGENDFGDAYDKLLKQRSNDPKYSSKKVHIHIDREPNQVAIKIRDEGKGFDFTKVLARERSGEVDPLELSGRGLLLIESYMDEVQYNEQGTEISLIRRLR